MSKIILISTVHRKRGNCNSNELLKIIERIAPEVIFEEIPPYKFAGIYEDGMRSDSLETETIKKYLQNHPVAHLPVDLDLDDLTEKRYRDDSEKMFNIFDQYREIQFLRNQHEESVERFGFPYLNSKSCIEIMERIHFIEKYILHSFNQKEFSATYKRWLEIMDERENEMINNIYDYYSRNQWFVKSFD